MSFESNRQRVQREKDEQDKAWKAFGPNPVAYFRKAAADFRTSKFANNPTDQERFEWAESHERIAIAIGSGEGRVAAFEGLYLCDARWLIAQPRLTPALPAEAAWAQQIVSYANVMSRARANREARSKGLSEGATPHPPTPDDYAMARNLSGAFLRWYRVIEDHQIRSHRCFMNLALTGNAAHVEMMRSVFRRGDEVNTQLARRLHGGHATLSWAPEFHLAPQGEDWAPLFPRQGNWTFRDVTEWWGAFAGAAERFYPRQPTLPLPTEQVGYGLDDPDEDIPF